MKLELAPSPPDSAAPIDAGDPCVIVAEAAQRAHRRALARRFFALVAAALGKDERARGCAWSIANADAGVDLAQELGRQLDAAWAREGIERGLEAFGRCLDETGQRCVAALIAEYFAWREPPDRFFNHASRLIAGRSAAELVRVAIVAAGYARLPKPEDEDDLRVLAAVPWSHGDLVAPTGGIRELAVIAFTGDPPVEAHRVATDISSLGSEVIVSAFAEAQFGWMAEPGPAAVPLVGRPLLWFPADLDAHLRRLHLVFAAAIA